MAVGRHWEKRTLCRDLSWPLLTFTFFHWRRSAESLFGWLSWHVVTNERDLYVAKLLSTSFGVACSVLVSTCWKTIRSTQQETQDFIFFPQVLWLHSSGWSVRKYWGGGGSRPNFEEKSYFDCFCRLSVRALGRPNRLNTTVPRAALIFGWIIFAFYKNVFLTARFCLQNESYL